MRYKRVLYICLCSLCLLCGCTKKEELILQSEGAQTESLGDSDRARQEWTGDESPSQTLGKDISNTDDQSAPREEKRKESGKDGTEEESRTIYVHVCGAVRMPGVYEMAADSRVYEAVQAAGGFAENADESYVNQAQELPDGAKLVIPTKEEARLTGQREIGEQKEGQLVPEQEVQLGIVVQEGTFTAGGSWDAQSKQSAAGGDRVNINTASLEELCKIPGIGTTRAAAIVSYREDHGGFERPEDIMQVSGIKEGTYEKIKDSISVK